ncbi:MAG TPA: alternative ribosome rescue aminoacyl-tRNA hydrolase ArfB [Acidimicrobiia bacterium]|jgi:ribosome-associated protein
MQVAGYEISPAELEWSFGPSGGPGGQHANRSNTRAQLRFDLGSTEAFPPELKARMMSRIGRRANEGVIVINCDDSRSQLQNRRDCEQRLTEMLEAAAATTRRRRPTGPSPASKEKRLQEKRRRSQTKKERGAPPDASDG